MVVDVVSSAGRTTVDDVGGRASWKDHPETSSGVDQWLSAADDEERRTVDLKTDDLGDYKWKKRGRKNFLNVLNPNECRHGEGD